ncbi:hypothetical protein P3T76_014510 [Phytophthora citrophthora]|uniref:Uncharacterized protein n=1 Tax=Phytophthora citrophthora TaxID=4793 RepID=A0AAD9G1R7_9STRA|nr:hypothetical protein P3T76_014510 [Phytophthora citrophthora]
MAPRSMTPLSLETSLMLHPPLDFIPKFTVSMAADWTFLKPWRNALRTSLMDFQSGTSVQFKWPHGGFWICSQHYLGFDVRLVDGDTQNVNRLNKVREAIVLFTVLALVNYKAFLDQFPPRLPRLHACKCYPCWVVGVYGEATVQQLVWGEFCADSDPSPQFQQAMQKLKAMGLENMNEEKNYLSSCAGMKWRSILDGVKVYANLKVNTSDIFDTGLQRLFIAAVPLVLLLDRATLCDVGQSRRSVIVTEQAPVDIEIDFLIHDLTTSYSRNLAANLPWKVVNPLAIFVTFDITSNDGLPQDMINIGILLNHLLTCLRLNDCTIKISCRKGFESFFPAIGSAIAAHSDVSPLKFGITCTASELWSWLLYTINCCSTATLCGMTLTQANLLSIADVVQYNYPLTGQEELQPRTYNTCEFGFVDIVEGITVWPIDTVGGGTSAFVMPSSTRCRAWFKGGRSGFGRCRTRVGNGVSEVSRDLVEQNLPTLSKLYLSFASIDSVSLAINLLELVGRNLRSLTMCALIYSNSTTLDLSVLSVVTAHNESLSRWPVAELTVGSNRKLSDFTLCLRNRRLRMARELTRLNFYAVHCEEREIQEFTSHDGDFLSVTKEKFPIQLKAALISVINYVHYSKPIHRLPADVLWLIFVFASTPTRRSVTFKWPFRNSMCCQHLLLRLQKGRSPENVIQLKLIREAIELFTLLSVVNNEAFTEHMSLLSPRTEQSSRRYYPEWSVYVCGTVADQKTTWSRQLEFSEPSTQYQYALQKLKMLRYEDKATTPMFKTKLMHWKCKCDGAGVNASLYTDKSDGIETDLQRLFDAGSSMIVQLTQTPDRSSLVDIWSNHRQQVLNANVSVSIWDLTSRFCRDLAAGLTTSSEQATINAGVLLARVYQWSQVVRRKVFISCFKLSKSVWAAICSTIAVEPTTPIHFRIQPMSPDTLPWSWLAFAVGCPPSVGIEFDIVHSILSKADRLSVAETLTHRYPVLTTSRQQLRPRTYEASEFGFVDIAKGTTVWSIDLEEGTTFVVPSSIRCRAWFKEDYVVVIVPRFGRCRSRIRDGVCEVSRDLKEQALKCQVLFGLYLFSLP